MNVCFVCGIVFGGVRVKSVSFPIGILCGGVRCRMCVLRVV